LLKDIEYFMLNQNREILDGYVLSLLLVDSLYHFQSLSKYPHKLISLIIEALTSVFRIRDLRPQICKVI
jgi:hypothetical protein